MNRYLPVYLALSALVSAASAQDRALHTFERQQLTDAYYSEGANAGDINHDGKPDVVYGPYWYAGPDFKTARELYPVQPQNRDKYADNFFNWVHDFNGDGWGDVFVVGFPGTPAFVYENPKADGFDKPWPKHKVFNSVANESPHFVNIVADERPELVCTFGGSYGFATINWDRPFEPWTFHKVSEEKAPNPFGHGLGVGDINSDGRQDILSVAGWFEQPKDEPLTARWAFHKVAFSHANGGAEMHAYDVDGDGDSDVITSLAAHDFGLAWYEQDSSGAEPVFRQHLIMGDALEKNRYGVVFSEPHSVALADIDGDGLKDIITGKTYWSHHRQSPMWDAGAVVYWFRLTRTKDGVDWAPYKADGEAGIGRQISIADVNGDKLPDIVVGGMVGAHVLLHKKAMVSEAQWRDAQPKRYESTEKKVTRGRRPEIDTATGMVAGALEGEALEMLNVSAGMTVTQDMKGFKRDRWSGSEQLFWSGGKPGDRLDLEFTSPISGTFDVLAAFTMARDYAIVKAEVDGQQLGDALDLYNYPDVITSGELTLGQRKLEAGPHKLSFIITGANAAALKNYMVGVDYLRLKPTAK